MIRGIVRSVGGVRRLGQAGACRSFCAAPSNLTVVKDMETFKSAVQGGEKLVVAWYNAKFSLWGKILEPEFQKMAASYPQHSFLQVDVDECPRAAYDAEVVDVPSVALMYNDTAWRQLIEPEGKEKFSEVLNKAKEAIDKFQVPKDAENIPEMKVLRDNLWAEDYGYTTR
uniref:Thioredoxin domain-containing protein n=1 Tax=Chromera velia CCMP2878 TaxID=1169474 RepID=A0A0G4H8K9_9ALVE|mmetsp:Transcript_17615/g.35746  ORF Transcript_17615/g.35746 Transcript_17615/m.35746 type:complete len:170 (-) Transcript_17615:504-1013(-)|eukprot:Cvel_5893.t1-p1 / transcript=Cvel_5893.t1 / gene=Cvel_5893 / organism=Chromera_velia_CCMP2878 / gene_product=hypothetical protein / transcript_product=hypothetical protein / location=Cvel_scaffold281:35785-36291(+) / protein_length=169 / sequence_SO=supercontig / SO=protein_coding / is_pseudo=false